MPFAYAVILIPYYDLDIKSTNYHCYTVKNTDSPLVQRSLEDIEEFDYLKIKNLGLLLVKEVTYGQDKSVILSCRKIKRYVEGGYVK